MGGIDYRILGSLEASREGSPIGLGGAKQKTVLALLLLAQGRVVTTDDLIEALWRDDPPAKPSTALQGYVSHLRKALDPDKGFDRIITETAGYRLTLERGDLDLFHFETLLQQGRDGLAAGKTNDAASSFREALALFRGPPLADFTYETWAQSEIGRLDELRLTCLEGRIEADLRLGRHGELVGELEGLIGKFPLRESLRAHLMLALYRAGRQSEALAAYQESRAALVEEFGIEPTRALQELERKILMQDESLDLAPGEPTTGAVSDEPELRSILVIPCPESEANRLARIAAPLATSAAPHELIVSRLIDASAPDAGSALASASEELNELRAELVEQEVKVRVASFTSTAVGADVTRLASEQDVSLVLIDVPRSRIEDGSIDDDLSTVLADAPCDVAIAVLGEDASELNVVVPFGGSEHDWAALELGAWLASTNGARLRLLGVTADSETGQRDASRLLAAASLAVQQLVGVPTVPGLVRAGGEEIVKEAGGARLVVGIPEEWKERGLGSVRSEILRTTPATIIFVRRGIRPGGLAPPASQTRYTWSLADVKTG